MTTFDDLEVGEATTRILDATVSPATERAELRVADTWADGVVARPVTATENAPPEPRSIMDGYAVTGPPDPDRLPSWTLVGESAAGHPFNQPLASGQAVRISTGAVVPPDATCVVAQEDAHRDGETLSVSQGTPITEGRFVRSAGSDWSPGDVLLAPGATIGPTEHAVLTAAGCREAWVFPPPRVAVLCTGDELISPHEPRQVGSVVSTNMDMLCALARSAGATVALARHVPDDLQTLTAILRDAADTADIVLTSGGVSVGVHDHLHDAVATLGAERLFRRLSLRPGRPMTAARLGPSLVLALPGNPASSYVCFELFARPAIRKAAGLPERRWRPIVHRAPLAVEVSPMRTRAHYMRARYEDGALHPLRTQASGNLRSLADIDGLVHIPAGPHPLPAGTNVDWILRAP